MYPDSRNSGEKRLAELADRFHKQHQFALNYSPLYAALFGSVANWLAEAPQDPAVQWLLHNTSHRAAFDVTNLLAAALHYEVLAGEPAVAPLAHFYPTVGGNASPYRLFVDDDHRSDSISAGFTQALHNAILARQETIAAYLKSSTVQTNETGRGYSWLFPASLAQWDEVYLIDLGASAGLNLLADQRAFQFIHSSDGSQFFALGNAASLQFTIRAGGKLKYFLHGGSGKLKIASRIGYDIHPFHIVTEVDERTLKSFIWADQIERVQRLEEAIMAFNQVQSSPVPIQLYSASLPGDLSDVLDEQPRDLQQPLLIYNTYIKMYLPRKGEELHDIIAEWAMRQNRPVIWIQWEPPQFTSYRDKRAPSLGWLAWTADLWHNKQHYQYQLGWVHPHGREVYWLPDLEAWILYWS